MTNPADEIDAIAKRLIAGKPAGDDGLLLLNLGYYIRAKQRECRELANQLADERMVSGCVADSGSLQNHLRDLRAHRGLDAAAAVR